MEKALCALVTPGYKDHIGLSTHNTTNWYVTFNYSELIIYQVVSCLLQVSSCLERVKYTVLA